MASQIDYPLGSGSRALRVAIIGSGPSGFYAAEALCKRKNLNLHIDLYDRLSTPYGLVRFGVAPDHQNIKAVIRVYRKVASREHVRFFGGVQLGRDITVEDLRKHYDQIIYAVGSETDRRLGIPGENLEGSYTATAFVGWYNSHPDYHQRRFNLSHERVVVVGVGNVAMDITRVLIRDPEELAKTDIAEYALEALRKSKVREVVLLGRRGPAQAAFSPKEIKEIADLKDVDLVVAPKDVDLDEDTKSSLQGAEKTNVDYLTKKSQQGEGSYPKKIRVRFCVSPVEILGENGQVRAVKIERNELYKDEKGRIRSRGTGQYEVLPIGLIFRSVGYRGLPLPGVPFDEKRGIISNREGRVVDPVCNQVVSNQYVVGWIKRGPTGLIGTNKSDSEATVKKMLQDIDGKRVPFIPEKTPEAVEKMLDEKNLQVVTFQDWTLLDLHEVETGKRLGKVREKFVTVSAMLKVLKKARTRKHDSKRLLG